MKAPCLMHYFRPTVLGKVPRGNDGRWTWMVPVVVCSCQASERPGEVEKSGVGNLRLVENHLPREAEIL